MPAVGEQALLKEHLLMHFISGAQILSNLQCTARAEEPTLTHSLQPKSRLSWISSIFHGFLFWDSTQESHLSLDASCFFLLSADGRSWQVCLDTGLLGSDTFCVVPLVRTSGKNHGLKGHLITQTRVRPRTSSLLHIGFTEQLAVRKAAARENGRTASLKMWLSPSGYT